uniref:Uncharacterized protein n=1 Tax=Arundo donax TaxID=35708 RepID=A0A0A8YUM5_ARUDO
MWDVGTDSVTRLKNWYRLSLFLSLEYCHAEF